MLRHTKDLHALAFVATDGATDHVIGDVKGLYFDEESWAIRYLVVSTGRWWLGHDRSREVEIVVDKHHGRAARWPGAQPASDRAALPLAA